MASNEVSLPEGMSLCVAHAKYKGANRFILALDQDNKPTRYFDGAVREEVTAEMLRILEANEPPDFIAYLKSLSPDQVILLIEAINMFKVDADPALLLEMMAKKRELAERRNDPDARKVKRVWYHDPKTAERSRVPVTEVDAYIAKGWKPGRDVDKTPDLRWYHRPVKDKPGYAERERISLSQIPAFVADGYFLGKGSGKTWNPDNAVTPDVEGTTESQHHTPSEESSAETPTGEVPAPETEKVEAEA